MQIDAFMCYEPSETSKRRCWRASRPPRGGGNDRAPLGPAISPPVPGSPIASGTGSTTPTLSSRWSAKPFSLSNFCQDQMNHAIARHWRGARYPGELQLDEVRGAPAGVPAQRRQPRFGMEKPGGRPCRRRPGRGGGLRAICPQHRGMGRGAWRGRERHHAKAVSGGALDGLALWDPSYAWNSSYLPTFMELLGEKKYIDRDFYFSVTFPFWRQRFWLTKRGQRVAASYLASEPDPSPGS